MKKQGDHEDYRYASCRYDANGKFHSLSGPAVIWAVTPDKISEGNPYAYYKHGKKHRTDGPAFKCKGTEYWCRNGKMHRLLGPAYVGYNHREWWIYGINVTKYMKPIYAFFNKNI